MMRDYKSMRRPDRRRKGRWRVLTAFVVLATTVGAVASFDLRGPVQTAVSSSMATPTDPLSVALAIPATPRAADATPAAPALLPGEPLLQVDVQSPVEADRGAAPPNADAAPSLTDADPPPAVPASTGVDTQLDQTEVVAVAASPASEPARWVEHRIARGESLAKIFADQGLDAALLHRIVNSSKQAATLAKIKPGQKLRFRFDENHELTRLELHRNQIDSLRVAIDDDGIQVEQVSKDLERRVAATAGTIQSSLFVDGQKAGLSDGQIMDMANIFGWDIDFALEIRAGDTFRVMYEEHHLDGEKLRDGPILAAEFTNRGTTYRAVRYEDSNGEVGYFDADGQSKRRAFIRTPIKFARVSSGFNPKRWHPVLQKWRSHKGVDYAAPTGTPVKATGDGRVVFRGTKGGYGNTVILEHAGKYQTLYAHLSKYSPRAKAGQRVKQGQVIGYVGMSGLATGPHLHYEFQVDGRHVDPLKVKLPKSLSLPKSELARFRATAEPLLARLEQATVGTMVASAETADNR